MCILSCFLFYVNIVTKTKVLNKVEVEVEVEVEVGIRG